MRAKPNTSELLLIGAGSAAVALLSLLPAGSVRVGSTTRTVRLSSLVGIGPLLIVCCLALAAVAVLESRAKKGPAVIAATGYGILALLTVIWIGTVEGVGRLIPRSILPVSVRRFTLGLGARPAPWIALVILLMLMMACMGRLISALGVLARRPEESTPLFVARHGTAVATIAGVALVGFGRNTPLAHAAWSGGTVNVEPWAVPWIGPASLVALIALVVCAAACPISSHSTQFALLGAACAWLVAATAALLAATSGLLVETGIIDWVARRVGQGDFADALHITGGSGSTIAFAGACLAGAGFAAQLALAGEDR